MAEVRATRRAERASTAEESMTFDELRSAIGVQAGSVRLYVEDEFGRFAGIGSVRIEGGFAWLEVKELDDGPMVCVPRGAELAIDMLHDARENAVAEAVGRHREVADEMRAAHDLDRELAQAYKLFDQAADRLAALTEQESSLSDVS